MLSINGVAKEGGGCRGYSPHHWRYFYIVVKILNLNMEIILQIIII